jgi:RNA polymerase sigma factor (sigma-70 family)
VRLRCDECHRITTAFVARSPSERTADASAVQALLSLLSRREEEVLLLRLEAMKYRKIADHLGISMNSVNTLLARALRKLHEATTQHAVKGSANVHEKKSRHRTS